MDMSINGLNDFPTGKVGMVIMANWWKSTLEAAKDIDFKNDVGVAEIAGEESVRLVDPREAK